MFRQEWLWAVFCLPAAVGLLAPMCPRPRAILGAMLAGVFATAFCGFRLIGAVFMKGPVSAASEWLRLDALSAWHLAILLIVFLMSSLYAWVYFEEERRAGRLSLKSVRLFAGLWCGALSAMALVLISNNLAIMWVGIEATTLLTAFLICVHVTRESLEAMWKYILICSIGVAFAFMGTLLAAASAQGLEGGTRQALLWTRLLEGAAQLDPRLMKAAFLFLLVGYGTKAGLAPMHSWLPDAHSQAPAPVSAIFSGFMLNTALYCIIRYVPVVEAATGGSGWCLRLLAGFGVFSILVGAAFIVFQKDLKRLLAYCSVEHLGIITLGFGLGGFGIFAALFHTLNHSLCKTLSFFAAGRLGQWFGSHDMEKMKGSCRVSRVWGVGLFGSLLALIGVAPFALFMSELQILKAALDHGAIVSLVLFLAGAGVVFIGMLARAIPLMWGKTSDAVSPVRAQFLERLVVAVPLIVLLALGLWMPLPLRAAIEAAARIVDPGTAAVSSALLAGGAP
ncbi:MAG: hydrogenase 4 subunit F [Lentisphaerae bacterium]|nr:hydrogenase 4 subunit F [Lentisphaerota bacterium]